MTEFKFGSVVADSSLQQHDCIFAHIGSRVCPGEVVLYQHWINLNFRRPLCDCTLCVGMLFLGLQEQFLCIKHCSDSAALGACCVIVSYSYR